MIYVWLKMYVFILITHNFLRNINFYWSNDFFIDHFLSQHWIIKTFCANVKFKFYLLNFKLTVKENFILGFQTFFEVKSSKCSQLKQSNSKLYNFYKRVYKIYTYIRGVLFIYSKKFFRIVLIFILLFFA